MQSILRYDTPDDFLYFRSASPTYRAYLESCGLKSVFQNERQYGWVKNVLGLFQVAKAERLNMPLDLEKLREHGFRRGIVIWVPWQTRDIPPGWRRLMLPGAHFMTTGFTTILPEYWKYWNERGRRSRKKFFSNPELRVERVEHEAFADAFLHTKVSHMFRSDYVRFFRSMTKADPTSVRSYLAFRGDRPIAGLAVHDFAHMSVHLVAFTSKEAKPLQVGTGLIDRWFADSLAMGLKYIHFDHLRDPHMTKDQQGYTDFKKNFLEYLVRFPDAYFRFVGSKTKQ